MNKFQEVNLFVAERTEPQILICDDNMFNLTTLQTMISVKFHLDTIICSSGQQALDVIQSRVNENE